MNPKRINFEDIQWERGYDPWKAYCQSKLADLMFAVELSRRCRAKGTPLLSNAAHPGYSRTNLQTSGPGKPPGTLARIVEKLAAQDAAHGTLPTLRAATEPNAAPGSYYGPDGLLQLRGDPVPVPVPDHARTEAAARSLWEIGEELTGVRFPA
jgi:NAD(P)-dependent dehydrogenase (short-subunit alcohol dehydrogenase family)